MSRVIESLSSSHKMVCRRSDFLISHFLCNCNCRRFHGFSCVLFPGFNKGPGRFSVPIPPLRTNILPGLVNYSAILSYLALVLPGQLQALPKSSVLSNSKRNPKRNRKFLFGVI